MSEDNIPIHEKYWGNLKQLISLSLFLATDINNKFGYTVIDTDDIKLAESLVNRIEPKACLSHFEKFITSTYKHWKFILAKDRTYFIDNAEEVLSVFSVIGAQCFKQLFSAKSAEDETIYAIDGEDADEFWEYFITFIKMSIRHIHRHRNPTVHRVNNTVTTSYDNKEYLKDINIEYWAPICDINLDFV